MKNFGVCAQDPRMGEIQNSKINGPIYLFFWCKYDLNGDSYISNLQNSLDLKKVVFQISKIIQCVQIQ